MYVCVMCVCIVYVLMFAYLLDVCCFSECFYLFPSLTSSLLPPSLPFSFPSSSHHYHIHIINPGINLHQLVPTVMYVCMHVCVCSHVCMFTCMSTCVSTYMCQSVCLCICAFHNLMAQTEPKLTIGLQEIVLI